ncbi:MAG: proline racemase family protein [Anaerolineales bacterium]|nr:MAG: proline racemase family protein [Anaerolineales bacterium]
MDWNPPDDWMRITSVDAHADGEPLRVITGGLPPIPGDTILDRRRYLRENLDHLRTALMWEPRGHADMYGAIMTDPVTKEADAGVLFMHNEGYSTMCGHGIIGLVTVALETGMLPIAGPITTVKLDTPAGLVTARARIQGDRVRSVAFENVPSFVYALDQTVDVPGIGEVGYDVAFGGAFYAYCQAADLGVGLGPPDFRRLIEVGTAVKHAVMESLRIQHPFEKDLSFLYGTIVVGPAQAEGADSRNVCIFAEGEVDRCPTGTGVSGRLALNYARGQAKLDQPFVVESIIGTRFIGRILGTTTFGGYRAVIPGIEGSAHIVGRHEFLIDPDDPLRDGFVLR